jgi:flagellar motor switch protein FliG
MNVAQQKEETTKNAEALATLAAMEPSGLVGVEKAAALFLAIGEENAGKLFAKLEVDEVKVISGAMAQLDTVKSKQIETLFVEFTEKLFGANGLKGSLDATERLLKKVLPADQVSVIMEDIRGPAGRTMWEKLSNVNPEILAGYLKGEYPQTVAVVLTKVKADQAAKVLALLPEMDAVDIMQRMLAMEVVQKDVLVDVEETLRSEFLATLARTNRTDPHEQLAAVFNALDRNSEARLLGHLEDRNRESAEKIKALMFTFDDLKGLDNGGMQTLLRSVDKADLALALKGAPEAIRDLVLANMAERAAKILKEDMENSGPVRLKDVDVAQTRIVTIAKQLADAGDLMISMGEDDDEMVF